MDEAQIVIKLPEVSNKEQHDSSGDETEAEANQSSKEEEPTKEVVIIDPDAVVMIFWFLNRRILGKTKLKEKKLFFIHFYAFLK